ncbi:MAG: Hsp20 family protein [Cyclobacteriaceae bacterium]
MKNKKLLRNLLRQGDILNTINGGSVQTRVKLRRHTHAFEIVVTAPSVPVEGFNLMLEMNRLILFTTLATGPEAWDQPAFSKSFTLPTYIDTGKIDAFYEDGKLTVILPFKDMDERARRKIDIRHL